MNLVRTEYSNLNSRQKENYNYSKVSAVLADYGFTTMRLTDDWQGADFIAQHIDGETFLKVQLKGRLTFDKKYCGKELYVAFFNEPDWFLYPHDEILELVIESGNIANTMSWDERGGYSYPKLSKKLVELLKPYVIGDSN